MRQALRIGAVAAAMFAVLYLLFSAAMPRGHTVTIGLTFPPKDQSRLAPPPLIREDVSHSFQTRKVAL